MEEVGSASPPDPSPTAHSIDRSGTGHYYCMHVAPIPRTLAIMCPTDIVKPLCCFMVVCPVVVHMSCHVVVHLP